MEGMALNPTFWSGRRVMLTGHTGFKGGWLALWLKELGAEVHGYSLPAEPNPVSGLSLWHSLRLHELIPDTLADLSDAQCLANSVAAFRPEIVLHLAAQPLVRESYRSPVKTYATNLMGTLNLLEAVRHCNSVQAVLVVTTDKCYENREWLWPYREHDSLGGHDPYSSSKACVELLCASWRASFFREAGIALATARAGNVIGGGDGSADRLLPDLLRCWQAGESVILRSPRAIRPWQYVLEPLQGYLSLAQMLVEQGDAFASAWNFGPSSDDLVSVGDLVERLASRWLGDAHWQVLESTAHVHEAGVLALDSNKARMVLGWRPRWTLDRALEQTLAWHQAWRSGVDMQAFSRAQIVAYVGEMNE